MIYALTVATTSYRSYLSSAAPSAPSACISTPVIHLATAGVGIASTVAARLRTSTIINSGASVAGSRIAAYSCATARAAGV